jgi:predicted RND superfamily exporter protein
MIHEAALPILVTTGTTVAGFLSLATSDITMLIQFGYASSMSLAANFVVTVTTLPLLLARWPVRRRATAPGPRDVEDGLVPRLMTRLAEINLRGRVPIFATAVLLALGSLVGWYRLRVDSDALLFFSEQSFLRQRIADFQAAMGGPVSFFVVVDSGRPDGVADPDVLRRIADLQRFVRGLPGVDTTVSIADHLATLNREMHRGDPAFERPPDAADQAAQYLVLFDRREVENLIDWDASTASVLVRHHVTGSWELGELLRRIDEYLPGRFPPGVTVRYTGENVLVRNAADYMAINELVGFASTLAIIALVQAWLFRSVRAGLVSVVPDVIPVLLNFGLMGLLGVPLNPGTALIASIALGIAVDDTVHHIVTYRAELRAHGDRRLAMVRTMRAQGRPIIYVSLALAGGFAILSASNFVPLAQFGAFSAFVMLAAMVSELTLTPILMFWAASWRGRWSVVAGVARPRDAAR